MEVYLAGGLTGNLSKFWKSISMELYIAGTLNRPYVYEKAMGVFLAGEPPLKNVKDADWEGLNILETYYYLQNNKEFPRLIGNFQNFLLDSGAFTFMSGAGVVDFDKYVEGYAAFIKKWNVKNFFELDIDSVDSTAWLYGNMSGSIYKFNAKNGTMDKTKAPEGKKIRSKLVAAHNFGEWVRFMKYARARL